MSSAGSAGYVSQEQRRIRLARLLDEPDGRRAYPLSFAQARLWVLDRFQPGNPAYNIPAVNRLQGWVDTNALERSLAEIVRRHETLRTTFEVIDGKPAQVVSPSHQIPLETYDLRSFPKPERDVEMNRFVFEEGRRPFDLAKGPLFRASLLKVDAYDHVLVLVMHHIVSDGWSMSVLYRELSTLYMAYVRGQSSPLAELPIQYADFAQWQSEWFRGDVIEEQLGYWRKQLAGVRPVLELATDRPRPPIQTSRGDLRGFTIDRQLCEDLKSLSQSQGATLFMTLMAAFKALLHRLSGETDIAVGSPIANRTRSELEGLIGFFVNTLVLRTDLSGDPTFLELLAREREVALGAYAHQDMPFEKLVEELQPDRNLAHNPFFQILFAVQNIGAVDRNAPQPAATASQAPTLGNGTAKFDLTMSLLDTGAGGQGCLEFNVDLFDGHTAEVLIERYQTLLRGVVENSESTLSELPILTAAEREEPPAGREGLPIERRRQEVMRDVLSAVAAAGPDAIAGIAEGRELRYAELNRRANQLARRLRAAGAAPGSTVAIAMARGLDALVGLAGILKAGCAYLPIDASEPATTADGSSTPGRVASLLAAARPALILVDPQTRSRIPPGLDRVFVFEELAAGMDAESDRDLEDPLSPEGIASVQYQAGADGTLRAIPITHRALCRMAVDPALRLTPSDRVAHLSHACSDSARFEIFASFAAGAAIVCMPDGPPAQPRKFATVLRDLGVTVLFAPVATVERLAREFPWGLRKVRLLLCDERFTDWARLRETVKPEVLDRMYSLWGEPGAGGYFAMQALGQLPVSANSIPVGNPLPGTVFYVLDKNLEPDPPGIPGELCVETDALPCQADAPSACLVPSPFTSTEDRLLFATGDVVRQLADGSLEYRGRRDGRLALAGLMVHPVEIESALRRHPRVRQAGVAPRRRHGLRSRGLAAFLETDGEAPSDVELRDFLAGQIPDFMVPTAFSAVRAIPRTVGGLVDRRSLEASAEELDNPKAAPEPYVAPRNEIETTLAQIWMDTVGIDRVGIKDNFFRLGGHSLLATQAVARIGDIFQIELPLQRLFEAPTIEELARIIEPLAVSGVKPQIPSIVRVPRDLPIPLSFAQQRLWFLDQFEPDSAFYNINIPVHLQGPMDAGAFEAAFNDLVDRHEPLRTTFHLLDGEPVQAIASAASFVLAVHDLRSLAEAARQAEMQRLATRIAQQPFDLKNGPVMRAELVKLADTDHVLLFSIHHIAADGWSMEILFRELSVLYDARRTGRTASLPELALQYADFACWQRKWLSGAVLERQLAYWKRQLESAPPLLELPTDRPRPRAQMFSGGMHPFTMPASLLESVKSLAEREEVTLFNVVLAGFFSLLYRYTGCADLVVGSPIANRTRPELEQLIGFFANTLVLRAQVSSSMTFRQLIARLREVTLGAYAHQDIPFEKLVEEFQPERNLSYNPIFQVMFALQNTGRPTSAVQDETTPVIGAGVAKFDLTMFVSETTSGFQAGIEYNSDLFDASTVARIAGHYEALLTAAAADPDRPLWAMSMLSATESMSLAEWNDTDRPFTHTCLHHLLEAQVARTPEAIAVEFGGREVSYRELDSRANYWAHRLIELGVQPDACVGIFLERSVDILVAVLATLKAGAAYVPIDPSYPSERIAFMLADSRAPILFTSSRLRDRLPALPVRLLDLNGDEAEGRRDTSPVTTVSPDHLAYVIYTSGSTGTPKGVAMPHAPLANLVEWQIARSALPEGARTVQFASLSFDVSFQEIFSTLCAGGRLVLVEEDLRRDPRAFWALLRAAQVNRLFLPFVALQQLAEQAGSMTDLPSSLTEVVTAGEQLHITPQIVALFTRLKASLYNQYGPTESHVVTEFKLVGVPRDWPALPAIGRAIPNAAIHILDSDGQPCAIGTPGELYIGGTALARGYIHRADLTSARFLADSQAAAGGRLYRTGDRARYLADGNIQFLGRVDDQVKVRGFRVEPGEVEAALRRHSSVREAAVVARLDGQGEYRLVAYVQSDPQTLPTSHDLRTHLAALLPEFMIPATFVVTGALPLTPSGKLNRRALPSPESAAGLQATAVAPRTPVEEILARVWRDVLQIHQVGIHDNFFELGGHSLLATRVISRIRDEFGLEFPVRRLFETPTIEALALSIVESALGAQGEDETVRLIAEIEGMPEDQARTLLHDGQA